MNESKGIRLIETIKSILLVVLFLFTVLLLFFFWENKPFQIFSKDDARAADAMQLSEIFQPDHMEIYQGGDPCAVTREGFDVMIDCFKAFSASKNLSIEVVPEDRYFEALKQPSIKAAFDYYVPFSSICEIYGIDKIAGSDSVDALSEFVYSVPFDDRMYMYDKKTNKYFRIVGSSNSCFDKLKSEIENVQADSVTYYPLHLLVGEIENGVLCPVSLESAIYDVPYYPEDYSSQAEKPSAVVKGFFSGNFDFVRRIEEENGTVIYMYGYGKIVVIAHNDGVLEFKTDDDRTAVQLKYLEAFEKANTFMAAHGAFESTGGIPLSPYVKDVIIDPEGKKGFRFVFGVGTPLGRIYYQSGSPVIVDVIGGRVAYYKKEMINIDASELDGAGQERREAFSAINVAANNLEYIRDVLAGAQIIEDENISNEELMEKVSGFDCGYFRPDNADEMLKASWIVTAGGVEFYFGLDDGLPRGYSSL